MISRRRRPARDVLLARTGPTGRSPSSAAQLPELLAEELRRLDEDDVYAAHRPQADRSCSVA